MSASRFPVSLVPWGDQQIPYLMAEQRANEALAISREFTLTNEVERWIDGRTWVVTQIDYFELARLLEKVREEQQE